MEKPGLTVALIAATLYFMYQLRREAVHSYKLNIYPTVKIVLKAMKMIIQELGINFKKELNDPFTLAIEMFINSNTTTSDSMRPARARSLPYDGKRNGATTPRNH